MKDPGDGEVPSREALMADREELDALEELGDEIAVLSGHMTATEYVRLQKVGEFDRRGGWLIGGYRNCADWLSFRVGLDKGAARERVRVARALRTLPRMSRAMEKGELSFSKARALTRVADPENEAELVRFAVENTAAQLEQMVRGWKLLGAHDEAELERRRHAARTVSVFPDTNGMYQVRGCVPAEVGALLMRAIEAASDALYRVERREALDDETTPDQRRADALGLMAERAMAAGFGGPNLVRDGEKDVSAETSDRPSSSTIDRSASESGDEHVSAETSSSDPITPSTPISGTRAERYQVLLHVDLDTLRADPDLGVRANLEDGTRVSAETARRLTCDAAIVPICCDDEGGGGGIDDGGGAVGGDGGGDGGAVRGTVCGAVRGAVRRAARDGVLNVGRKRRTIPPAIRRALDIRDGGCRFPGCGLRFCDGHHIRHWVFGGETKLGNLILLCPHHHRLVHHHGFRVEPRGAGAFKFFSPEGLPLGQAPPSIDLKPGDPMARMIRANRKHGIVPLWNTGKSKYERESDIPDSELFAALEAMG